MDRLSSVLVTFVTFLSELVVLFLAVSFAVTLLTRWIGIDRVGRWMGGGPLAGALKGIALGFATPFCTYSAIPMLVGLRQAGVRQAATVGFLLAAPVLDPLLFAAFAVLFSPGMALSYSLITFAGVLAMAVLADAAKLHAFRPLRAAQAAADDAACSTASAEATAEAPAAEASAAGSSATGASAVGGSGDASSPSDAPPTPASCAVDGDECASGPAVEAADDEPAWRGWRPEARHAWREAVDLTRGMAGHIVGAVAIAALVMGYLPEGLLLDVAGPERWYAIPAAALVGVPFYVSVEALAPVGAALASKGMGVGAVFALTIAGAGVNVPEFALLSRLVTRRGLVGLVGAVFTVAVAGGFAMQML